MITKTIRHNISGSKVTSTTIEWKVLGITVVKKTLYYPKLDTYDVSITF